MLIRLLLWMLQKLKMVNMRSFKQGCKQAFTFTSLIMYLLQTVVQYSQAFGGMGVFHGRDDSDQKQTLESKRQVGFGWLHYGRLLLHAVYAVCCSHLLGLIEHDISALALTDTAQDHHVVDLVELAVASKGIAEVSANCLIDLLHLICLVTLHGFLNQLQAPAQFGQFGQHCG